MKKLKTFKKITIAIVAIVINVNLAYSQGNNWKLDGNDNVTNRNFIGTTNNKDLNFKTNNETRMVVTKDGDVNVSNTLSADSIHVRSLSVGNNSFCYLEFEINSHS